MQIMRSEANYFADPKKVRSQRASKASWMSSILAVLLIAVIFVGTLGLNPSVAFAADDDGFDSGPLDSAFGDEADPKKLNDYLDQYGPDTNSNSFQYVLGRLLIPDYINYLPKAVVAGNAQSQASAIGFAPNGGTDYSNYICHDNQRGAGTPVYHNCDVPNFSAEFVQNLYSLFDRSGAQNAFALNAASILFPQFGQPKAIPGGSVPADTTGASNKYTGLEAFGYDLQLSSYLGEWDHIQTLNQSRLLTNFSFFDSVNLTAQSIGNAIGGAFDRAGAMSAQGWNTGGIFGAIGGFFSGLYEGGASGAINTMLDTSESNTVLTFGWYRTNYSETAYGLRELSNQEIVAQIRYAFLSYMSATMPEDMSYDQWLKSTDPGGSLMKNPPDPPIANCTVYTTPGGSPVVHGTDADAPPGITADRCDELKQEADRAYFASLYKGVWSSGTTYSNGSFVYYDGSYYRANGFVSSSDTAAPGSAGSKFSRVSEISGTGASARYDLGAPDGGDGRGGWDKDGARKAQSFNQWYSETKAAAGDWDGNVSKYGIDLGGGACSPANADVQEEAAAKSAYNNWLANCWTKQWGPATEKNEIENQTNMNTTWLTSILTGSTLAKWSAANPGVFDFNSPWKRFVCLNPNGSDVTAGTYEDSISRGDTGTPILVSAFNGDGSVNTACPQKEYRPPIQGGLFGDGYYGGLQDQNPGNDTRHISNFYGPSSAAIYPFLLQPINSLTQMTFTLGQFATQVSNEIITWTYMPILESLGIHDLVENLIKSLREGIFFPLASLIVAATALYVLYQAGVKRRYRDMFISVAYVALLFIIGVGLMFRPGDIINLVDRAPANVEKAVMSLILTPSISEDKICATGSSAPSSTTTAADWDNLDIGKGSNAGAITDIFSKNYNTSDDALREVLCTNWKAFVYYPWAFAQWGTSPANLNASSMENTNQALVGDATVDLGGSNGKINNWAVYQLKSMKIGSSTTIDWNITGVNVKSKDFYRLVDLQAGPNNGAGTDPRYLQSWSGMDPFARMGVGVMSGTTAVLGLVTVAVYSVTKILITFTSVMLLMFLPIVFLFGLFPTKRKFVRDYIFTILSLMLQRIALMLMIALFLFFLMSLISVANNYMSVFLSALLISIIFLKFRKPIMNFAMSAGGAGSSVFGRMANRTNDWAAGMTGVDGASGLSRSWGQTGRAIGEFTPKTARNYGERVGAALRNGSAGAVAGLITGRNPLETADEIAGRRDVLIQRKQRAAGMGNLQNALYNRKQMSQKFLRDAKDDSEVRKHMSELQSELPEVLNYYDRLDDFNNAQKRFRRDLNDRKIIQEPRLDEFGDHMKDEDGEPLFNYHRVGSALDPETGERISTFVGLVEPPKAPEKPDIVDRDLTIDDLGFIRRYGKLSDQKQKAINTRNEARERLYDTSNSESFKSIVMENRADPNGIRQALLDAMPDSKGFTDVSRQEATRLLDVILKADQEIANLDEQMDKQSKKYADKNSEYTYEAEPLVAQAAAVQAIQERIEERDGNSR